ncbi:MAG: hypothetical protein GTO45_07305 [Candidatus Aminicenantes bacterium]|nr:hypothetical protein [Candidatus Aminicenantes bacterium]NIM78643.1 hypothetical protein [Candidatus Aminicenantes bacterium]NIN17890.1 hypothetical protein [Candidatus Aminicenantes bacterium]NIN41793.1 hypothetical protein [Candidatus Aminicenantes bacterium]NIN84545.1 hypothetical protein [Candidatus Aminicenantes bacterium]
MGTKNDIEKEKLELERLRLDVEREKIKAEKRFTSKHLGTIITALISVAALIVSAAQVYIATVNKDKEMELNRLHIEREWKLKTVEYVSNNWGKIFSNNEVDANRMRDIMLATFPEEITGPLFIKLKETVDTEKGKKTWRDGMQTLARVSANKIRVFLHYKDPKDKSTLESISDEISKAGYKAEGIEKVTQKTEGDIRFYYEEDEIHAIFIKGLILKRLKGSYKIQDIKLLNIGGRYKNVSRGKIEVWLPSLEKKDQ